MSGASLLISSKMAVTEKDCRCSNVSEPSLMEVQGIRWSAWLSMTANGIDDCRRDSNSASKSEIRCFNSARFHV